MRQLERLIDAMNKARYRLQVLEADLTSGQSAPKNNAAISPDFRETRIEEART